MTRWRCLLLAALALGVALSVTHRVAAADLRGGTFEPPRPAADFALRAADGSMFRLTHHRGKVIALTFGYTRCPDVCPTTLADLAQMRAHFGEAGKQVQVVYITVDPDRDSPERMATYTRAFDRTFVGLSGPGEELARIWKAYGVSVARRPTGGDSYTVHHSAVIYLIDRRGRLRALLPFGTAVSDIAHDVSALLGE